MSKTSSATPDKYSLRRLRSDQLWYWLKATVRDQRRRLAGHRYTWNPRYGEVAAIPKMAGSIPTPNTYLGGRTFRFFNTEHQFPDKIDWNYSGKGKWWAHQLNAFDYLNQPGMPGKTGFRLIELFLDAYDKRVGEEPYPLAQRLFNWVKFLSREGETHARIESAMHAQLKILSDRLELHLSGHELLEESLALVLGAWYLRKESALERGLRIAGEVLDQQILDDGGHFERSPMYHQLCLYRLLDLINVLMHNPWEGKDPVRLLLPYASRMLGWLQLMTFSNGSVPLFHDSANGLAPASLSLLYYAGRLNILPDIRPLSESGYRRFEGKHYQLLVDAGPAGPRESPYHAHCNALGFELYAYDLPCLVDTGTSTFEENERRSIEKSTSAHNTVQVGRLEQSEMKGSFQVGRRARVSIRIDEPDQLELEHDGFSKQGLVHRRHFVAKPDRIRITDLLLGKSEEAGLAHFHFAPGAHPRIEGGQVSAGEVAIHFNGQEALSLKPFHYAPEFNRQVESHKLMVSFHHQLQTTFEF